MSNRWPKPPKLPQAESYRYRRRYGGYFNDPTPGPYPGTGAIIFRPYETAEQRAFRRFPVDRHKPPSDAT